MAKISISSGMKKYFFNKTELSVEAESVRGLLRELELQFPESKNKIVNGNDVINRYVKIFVDGTDISDLDQLNTVLNSKSNVKILVALAGG